MRQIIQLFIDTSKKEDKPPSRPPMIEEKQQQPTVSVNTTYEISELKKDNIALKARMSKLEHVIKCMVDGYQSQ